MLGLRTVSYGLPVDWPQSVCRQTKWRDLKVVALCEPELDEKMGFPCHSTPAPEEKCSCGIHGLFGPNKWFNSLYPHEIIVLIEAYGTIIVATEGFRAERAEIVATVIPDPALQKLAPPLEPMLLSTDRSMIIEVTHEFADRFNLPLLDVETALQMIELEAQDVYRRDGSDHQDRAQSAAIADPRQELAQA